MKAILICALLQIALVATCPAQQSIAFRLVHPRNSELAQDALQGYVTEQVGYDVIVKSNTSKTNYYWINNRPIISEEHIAQVEWRTNDTSGVTVTFTLTRPGNDRLECTTHNNTNQQLAIFAGDSFMMIVPITHPVTANRIVARNIFNTAEAEELKHRIEEKAEPAGGAYVAPEVKFP